MARRQATGEIAVVVIPGGVADRAAPTKTEIDAGVPLQDVMTRGGLSTPDSGQTVDLSDAGSTQNKTGRGNHGGDAASITCHRDSDTAKDEAWDTLHNKQDGDMVIRRFGGSDVPIDTDDDVEVWPFQVTSRAMADAGDESQRFTSQLSIPDEVEYDAVVVAGA